MNCKIVEPENLYTDFLCRHKSQHGGGSIPHFSGVQFQKGYGIGNVLGNLFRNIIPIARTAFKVAQPVLKKTGKNILRKGIQTGVKVIKKVGEGENIKEVLNRESRQALKEIRNQALSDITQLRTKKINKNERKRKRKKPVYSKTKRIKRDILD